MAFLSTKHPTESPTDDFDAALRQRLSAGWVVKTDGPSGVQLVKPKKMRALDSAALVAGAVLLLVMWPAGLVLIGAALVDYAFLTKEQQEFLVRPK